LRDGIREPRHWIERAEEARSLAQCMSNPQAKVALLAVANGYEKLAKLAAAAYAANSNLPTAS